MPISLLALNPTSDRNVDADERMAAMMPASINAPSNFGIIVNDAQIVALSGGSRVGSPRLMTVITCRSKRSVMRLSWRRD